MLYWCAVFFTLSCVSALLGLAEVSGAWLGFFMFLTMAILLLWAAKHFGEF